MKRRVFSLVVLLSCLHAAAIALDYPGMPPGEATRTIDEHRLVLENRVLRATWRLDGGRIAALSVVNKHNGQTLHMEGGHMPRIVLNGRTVDLAAIVPSEPLQLEDDQMVARFEDESSKLGIRWSVSLKDEGNDVTQTLELTASRDVRVEELAFLDSECDGARQVGEVAGSVVVCGDMFLAVEHPLAENTVGGDSRVLCVLPRGNVLEAGETWRCTSVIGVTPPNQLRRGFLYYLERRRARPYRPFLNYNSWYHLNYGRPNHRMTEAECLETIEHIGRELVEKRGVKFDAFVWDDGWDDYGSLWGFNDHFPNGFQKLDKAGARFGAAQGVWMSPWGGYGSRKDKRLAYGRAQGYETNQNGFSMAGPKYRDAFLAACLNMMRHQGVVFLKFDGMGAGLNVTGADSETADDIDAVLNLTRELHRENPNVFISATVGTWASPFWTLYADSVWRQGSDTAFHGVGTMRQRWITYRDMFCYRRIVQLGPLHPLNALMLHGPCVGERGSPGRMNRDEKCVADEIWSFFGSGANLQELYISPHLLTPAMWDELAAASKWSRAGADVLVDTHWIGGDPGNGEVYGWASWQPRKGVLVLRNPADTTQTYEFKPARDLELPKTPTADHVLTSARPDQRIDRLRVGANGTARIEIEPFEVLVFDVTAVPDVAPRSE